MKKALSIIAISLLVISCSRVPSHIIQPEKMARLMADVHTGEAVIDLNRNEYLSDSVKQALKQSVYIKHGVSAEQVDSSLAWYGRNITYYMDVYDRTIEILEHRLIESGNRVAAEMALSIAGDSVDIWPYPRYISVYDNLPTKSITFNFARDANRERGDVYIWRAKFFNNSEVIRWGIVAEYSDGTVEYFTQSITGDGNKELSFQSDSLLDATRIYGFLDAANRRGTSLDIDSIELVRKRLDRERYSKRYTIHKLPKLLEADSTAVAAADSIAAGDSTTVPDEQ